MIKYRIKDRSIEIEWDTGLENAIIMKVLELLILFNEVKK